MDESKDLKIGFFKKIWYSIFKLEKYGEMSADGLKKAIFYTIKLALIFGIIVALGSIYKTNLLVGKGKEFLETQVGDFYYKDGVLIVSTEEPIKAPSSTFGEVIINTNTETEEDDNKIINSDDFPRGLFVLKDRVVIKGIAFKGRLEYKYEDMLEGFNISELNKDDVINFINGGKFWKIYVGSFFIVGLSVMIAFSIQFLWYSVILGIFGYLVTFFTSVKMRFVAIFNMACYSFTLSIFLQMIYAIVKIFIDFEIKYFQVMYIAVATIYLIAAIFLIKSEFIKQQIEKEKIRKLKKEEEQEEQNTENKEEKKEEPKDGKNEPETKEKNNDQKKKEEKKNKGIEPEGSEA